MSANVLIVDDLDTNIKVLEAKILKEYYIAYTAKSAKEAFGILEKHKIDVILLDCMMPEMDGFEACKIIKSSPKTMHIPVVIVTALSDVEDKIKGLEAGADEFLTKPVNDSALFARLKSLSSMKTAIDELILRNKTNADFGVPQTSLEHDFSESKVLMLNDDLVQSKNISDIISPLTTNIKVASDPNEMKQVMSDSFVPDLVIISCQMEDQDPLRMLSALKNNNFAKYSSVMMLSEEDTMPVVLRALDLGASEYIILPVESNELMARIRTQLHRKYYTDMLRNHIENSVSLSVRDPLSGLYNRRYFDMHLGRLISRAREEGGALYAMMLDIDNFKAINDQYGHHAGDEVIKSMAYHILKNIPITDLAARYGGEEFIILIYHPQKDIKLIAEELRQSIAYAKMQHPVTISIGVSALESSDSEMSLISRADKALYQAKQSGKNKVVQVNLPT